MEMKMLASDRNAVSIVVIAYNVRACIARCLESIERQTLSPSEVIVVDDASTDDSLAVIRSFHGRIPGLKCIHKEKNEGAHLARRSGVLSSTGDYIVFVDGDDELSPSAIEVLSALLARRQCDILRFGRTIVSEGGEDFVASYQAEHAFNATISPLFGEEILPSVFSDERPVHNTWSVIDCAFRGEFVRSAFQMMTDKSLGRMQDAYEFFVLASRAESFLSVTEYHGLLYHFGAGVSGFQKQGVEAFERGQKGFVSTVRAVSEYASSLKAPRFIEYARWFKNRVFDTVANEWTVRIPEEEKTAAFASLRSLWGDADSARILLRPLNARIEYVLSLHEEASLRSDSTMMLFAGCFEEVECSLASEDSNDSLLIRYRNLTERLSSELEEIERQRREEEERLARSNSPVRKLFEFVFPEGSHRRRMVRFFVNRTVQKPR